MVVSTRGSGVPSGVSENSMGSITVKVVGLLARPCSCAKGGTWIGIQSLLHVAAFMNERSIVLVFTKS